MGGYHGHPHSTRTTTFSLSLSNRKSLSSLVYPFRWPLKNNLIFWGLWQEAYNSIIKCYSKNHSSQSIQVSTVLWLYYTYIMDFSLCTFIVNEDGLNFIECYVEFYLLAVSIFCLCLIFSHILKCRQKIMQTVKKSIFLVFVGNIYFFGFPIKKFIKITGFGKHLDLVSKRLTIFWLNSHQTCLWG